MTEDLHVHQSPETGGICPGISVVVPVFHGEESLGELVRELGKVLAALSLPHELLLINDGSRDRSWEVICDLARANCWVRGVNLMKNYGQHNALLCGVRLARFDVLVTLDDDLQHPPEEIPKLLAKLEDGYDLVYATPRKRRHAVWRNCMARWTKASLARILQAPIIEQQTPYKAFRTRLREAFDDFGCSDVLLDVPLSWATDRVTVVSVDYRPRRFGKSNYGLPRLFNMTITLVTGYSTAPLRLASAAGCLFTLLGIFVLAYVIVMYLVRGDAPQLLFLTSIIALLGGMHLLTMGICGEYLARIFKRSLGQPPYMIARWAPQESPQETQELGTETRETR